MGADSHRLRAHVGALTRPRHPTTAPDALRDAEDYVAHTLSALGLPVERPPFRFGGAEYRNVLATKTGTEPARPRVLVGAHFDTVPGTPGADDNASGVAAVLEVARLLAGPRLATTVEFAGFNLEEPQGVRYRIGSTAHARAARRQGVQYAGALILEMVGYTDVRAGSQRVPRLLFWKRVPRSGTFVAATGDGQSAGLLRKFAGAATAVVPALPVVTFRTPLRGWLVFQTRLSDNASFWDQGYPALMITDTAFMRNPHYHRPSDGIETLDFEFMARVVDAVVRLVTEIGGGLEADPRDQAPRGLRAR